MTAKEIKAVRNALGLNQVQLASLLGVHPVTVSKWERERDSTKPTPFQETMLRHFNDAAQHPDIKEKIGSILIGFGVGIALALLLNHLIKNEEKYANQ